MAKEQALSEFDIVINTPDGFTKADNFAGFVQPESFATIKTSESIHSIDQTIDSLLKAKSTIISSEKVTISDKKGVLVKSNETINGNDFQLLTLIFGDQISTITITASYPSHLVKGLASIIKTSLMSTRWLRLPQQQLFQGLPFALDQSDNLTIVKRTANSVVLINKVPFDTSETITPLLVASSVASEKEIIDIKAHSKQQLASQRFESEITITNEEETKINGIRAYHIIASATDKKTQLPVTIYQTIAFQQFKYLLIQGIVEQSEYAQYAPQFEQIIASVKFKKLK
jgi:phosphotransferase system HPr-like phosphotransfer protein